MKTTHFFKPKNSMSNLNLKQLPMKTIKLYSLMAIALFTFSACSEDDDAAPEIINEEEVITTMTITLTDNDGTTKTMRIVDNDGGGPEEPSIKADDLDANTSYSGTVEFLNETETPAEDITVEVAEESEEHQVFYVPSASLNASVEYNDQDANGNPLGLEFTLTTGNSSNGTLTVLLLHEGNKAAEGVSDGDPSNAGGETDIEAVFEVNIL